jgi:hypothetical protein
MHHCHYHPMPLALGMATSARSTVNLPQSQAASDTVSVTHSHTRHLPSTAVGDSDGVIPRLTAGHRSVQPTRPPRSTTYVRNHSLSISHVMPGDRSHISRAHGRQASPLTMPCPGAGLVAVAVCMFTIGHHSHIEQNHAR